jgi:response regulator RpfG family c-di-GMP phosphodiesterase
MSLLRFFGWISSNGTVASFWSNTYLRSGSVPEIPVNVLIVDDKRENLVAMESTLAGLKLNPIFANSAREALRYWLTNDVALILLDVQMPGVNGL